MKLGVVEYSSAIVGLGRHPVVFPAESQVEGERRSNFPLVLEIGHVEGAPVLVAAPWGGEGNAVKRSGGQGRFKITGILSERKVVVGSLALVQPNPTNLHAGLECVSTMRPDQVIDDPVSGSNLNVGIVVVEPDEGVGAYRIGESARLRIMKWGSIDVDLGFIEEI